MRRFFLTAVFLLGVLAWAQVEDIPGPARQKAECAAEVKDDEALALPYVMPEPSFKSRCLAKPFTGRIDSVRLSLVSKQANDITDIAEWFLDNGLYNREFKAAEIESLGSVAKYQGVGFTRAIEQRQGVVVFYGSDHGSGRYLVAYDENGAIDYALDFEKYLYAPEYIKADYAFIAQGLRWAQQHDGVLYVANGHNTYARSSKGMNAYITAIDTQTKKVIWRSQPLVANANSFEIIGDVIISGYGFTAEPDFIYVLNRHDGTVLQKIKVPSGPEYIVRKNDRVYVRTYDTNLVFKIVTK